MPPSANLGPVTSTADPPAGRPAGRPVAGAYAPLGTPATTSGGMDIGMVLTIAGHRFISELLRLVARPPLGILARTAALQSTEVALVLRATVGVETPEFDAWSKEYEAAGTPRVLSTAGPESIPEWTMEDSHALLLYMVVRKLHPQLLLETGVHNGRSTRALLLALARNGAGTLVSTEIDADVGGLVEPALRSRWQLKVIPATSRAVRATIAAVGPIDFFLHDSRHTYPWQRLEYRLGWEALRPGGWLLSDDVDASYAFLDACRSWGVRPTYLVGSTKVLGLARKPGPPA
jgi:hypothetical protein